jgi:hypothetical protein
VNQEKISTGYAIKRGTPEYNHKVLSSPLREFIGLIAPELFKSAAAFMRKAVEDIEKDPELRLYSPTNS